MLFMVIPRCDRRPAAAVISRVAARVRQFQRRAAKREFAWCTRGLLR